MRLKRQIRAGPFKGAVAADSMFDGATASQVGSSTRTATGRARLAASLCRTADPPSLVCSRHPPIASLPLVCDLPNAVPLTQSRLALPCAVLWPVFTDLDPTDHDRPRVLATHSKLVPGAASAEQRPPAPAHVRPDVISPAKCVAREMLVC